MPRTTLDIDPVVLGELRRRQRAEGRTLGELASELLERALRADDEARVDEPFEWHAQPLHARVDLEDKDAVWAILDRK